MSSKSLSERDQFTAKQGLERSLISAEINEYVDLFSQDKSNHRDTLQNHLKQYFGKRLNNATPINKRIQADSINPWLSYSIYENIRLDTQWHEERQRINKLFTQHGNLLDSNQSVFLDRFPRELWQLTFELVMANFLKNKFQLKEKNCPPDLEFDKNNQRYFVECTTAASSLLDQYDQLLPKFEKYFFIAKNLHENSTSDYWYFESNIDQCWRLLSVETKAIMKNKLNIDNDDKCLELINNWLFLNRYTCFYFNDILPEEIKENLKTLSFPMDSTSNETTDLNFIIKRISIMLIDKLKKEYFHRDRPGIIAIGLSMLGQGIIHSGNLTQFISSGKFFEVEAIRSLNYALNTLIKKENIQVQEKILLGLKNLYAIIIDTHWYNWFPDIVAYKYGGQFPENHQNHYGVLYNETYKNYSEDFIFNHMIPYGSAWPLFSEIY